MLLQELAGTSELKVSEMLTLAFNLGDYLTQLWNFFMVFSGVVIGWRFSAKDWGRPQKIIATALYSLFIVVNGMTLYRTYVWLDQVLADLQVAAKTLDAEKASHIKEMMLTVSVPYEYWQKIIYLVAAATVILSLSVLPTTATSTSKKTSRRTRMPT